MTDVELGELIKLVVVTTNAKVAPHPCLALAPTPSTVGRITSMDTFARSFAAICTKSAQLPTSTAVKAVITTRVLTAPFATHVAFPALPTALPAVQSVTSRHVGAPTFATNIARLALGATSTTIGSITTRKQFALALAALSPRFLTFVAATAAVLVICACIHTLAVATPGLGESQILAVTARIARRVASCLLSLS